MTVTICLLSFLCVFCSNPTDLSVIRMSLQINPMPKNKNCEMQLLITWTDVKCVSPQITRDWH